MEFLDEDARPRFLFQSKAVTSSATETEPHYKNLSKPWIICTVLVSLVLLGLAFFFLQSEPYQSLLIWVALSILVGPFAPPSVTGGDVRVGHGPVVDFPEVPAKVEDEAKRRRQKPRRFEDSGVDLAGNGNGYVREERKVEALGGGENGVRVLEEERDWVKEDVEVLKKQLVKNPVGKPRRWEVIAEAFGGRYKVESVIKKAKELGEKKVSDSDSYAEFLRNRKPNEKKMESGSEEVGEEGNAEVKNAGGWVSWGASEDIALLNALKAFPKEVSMRWEKIAAAVPGKTKVACVKRVAELKKGFRSAKAATDE